MRFTRPIKPFRKSTILKLKISDFQSVIYTRLQKRKN